MRSREKRGFDSSGAHKRSVRRHVSAVAIAFAACMIAPAVTHAQQTNLFATQVSAFQTAKTADVESYWTAERILSAKPFEIQPKLGSDGLPLSAAEAAPAKGSGVRVEGAAATVASDSSQSKVLVSESEFQQHASATAGQVTPEAFSPLSGNPAYTTSRVFPDDATYTYPYLTAGILFFTDYGGNYYCTASVLRLRVVVTAGHCVASPASGSTPAHFHWNFAFIPAYRDGVAPVGVFYPYWWTTTADWYYSDGSVPNAQDVGLLDMFDRYAYKIGQYTGYLGYWTYQLPYNSITTLGYPSNLDYGGRMEANYAQTFSYGGNNTWIVGADFGPGSSGGPWIRDFGIRPIGAQNTEGGNYVITVTSYGPTNLYWQYMGASNLDYRFTNLLSYACSNAGSGGC